MRLTSGGGLYFLGIAAAGGHSGYRGRRSYGRWVNTRRRWLWPTDTQAHARAPSLITGFNEHCLTDDESSSKSGVLLPLCLPPRSLSQARPLPPAVAALVHCTSPTIAGSAALALTEMLLSSDACSGRAPPDAELTTTNSRSPSHSSATPTVQQTTTPSNSPWRRCTCLRAKSGRQSQRRWTELRLTSGSGAGSIGARGDPPLGFGFSVASNAVLCMCGGGLGEVRGRQSRRSGATRLTVFLAEAMSMHDGNARNLVCMRRWYSCVYVSVCDGSGQGADDDGWAM